jgi:hypothetical protein
VLKSRDALRSLGQPDLLHLKNVTVGMSESCLKLLQAQTNEAQVEPMVASRQARLQRYKDKVSEYIAVSRKVKDDAKGLQEEYTDEQTELNAKYHKDFTEEFEEVWQARTRSCGESTLNVLYRRLPTQMNHTIVEIDAMIADTQSDIALQPEVDNAAEARLQRERKEHDEILALVATQSAKKAKYDRLHETAKVRG